MRLLAQVVFFTGLIWLVGAILVAKPLVMGRIVGLTSDYYGQAPMSGEEMRIMTRDLAKKVPDVIPNPFLPVGLLVLGGVSWAILVKHEKDQRRRP